MVVLSIYYVVCKAHSGHYSLQIHDKGKQKVTNQKEMLTKM